MRITESISLRQGSRAGGAAAADEEAGRRQRVVGVVDHIGPSATSGHYTASVRDDDGRWWFANDADVREQRLEEDGRQAYLLAYKMERP